MTDEGAPFQPGTEQITVPLRPRGTYAGYRAFGGGDGAVLVKPEVARELRSAAEFATQERRVTGGLLFGRGWADDQGAYLVIDGFVEAGPGENSGDRLSRDGTDDFTLSGADLRLLREDAARMYANRLELGWWRTRAALGEFGPRDFMTQAELVGPDGVGLLVYGSGLHWGTAYLGPDGHAPDSAGTLVAAPGAVSASPPRPQLDLDPEAALGPGPELVDISAGESMRHEPQPQADPLVPPDVLTPAAVPPEPDTLTTAAVPPGTPVPRRARPRMPSRVRVPPRVRSWAARPASAGAPGPGLQADVQLVVGALAIVTVAAAIIIGVLVHSVIVTLIIAAIGLLAIFSTVWMTRR